MPNQATTTKKSPKSSPRSRSAATLNMAFVALALAAGAIVRFTNIAKSSIWHDEGFTMMLAPQSPLEIIARTARDVHPPLYYITLHYWMLLFGNSETAARGLSAVFMLGTIVIGFLLVKRLFGDQAARLSAIFLALGPFVVRYSQEARMYGMVAFLLTLATYFLVRALQDHKKKDWLYYALTIAASLYTHYYAVFVILAHWIFIAIATIRKDKRAGFGLFDKYWWGANVLAAGLFLPWVPVAYSQFTRVQNGFWIPPVNAATMPGTVGQFLTFTDMGAFPLALRLLGLALVAAVIIWAMRRNRQKINEWTLLILFFMVGPLSVFLLSFKRPIYVDRYFVFAAVAFYLLLAVMTYEAWPMQRYKSVRWAWVIILTGTFLVGIHNVYSQANHQMKATAQAVNLGYRPGDEVLSIELYSYFDFSYYNHTGYLTKLYDPGGMNGYNETSLLYDRSSQISEPDLNKVRPASGYVWVVGRGAPSDDSKHLFDGVTLPSNWQPASPHYQYGDTQTERYKVD